MLRRYQNGEGRNLYHRLNINTKHGRNMRETWLVDGNEAGNSHYGECMVAGRWVGSVVARVMVVMATGRFDDSRQSGVIQAWTGNSPPPKPRHPVSHNNCTSTYTYYILIPMGAS